MNSLRRFFALAVLLVLAPAAVVRAQSTVTGAPTTIDYQGKALDASGNPLANTTPTNYEMQFRIYDAQESGTIIWSEKQIVTVSKGLFSVRLGEGTANGTEGSVAQTNLAGAFDAKERFLGVSIVITGQSTVEILPRLAFLATPFAYVANKSISAERLILNPSTSATPSSINLAQVSYATQAFSTTTTLTDQNHTAIVDAGGGAVTVNLPGVTSRREYYVAKKDSSANFVTIAAPSGGTINGSTAAVKLKVLGDSVVIQNTANNDWWIVSDTRDKTPVGTVIIGANNSSTPPPGYVACNGATYSRTAAQFVDLYAAIGIAWGNNNSATDFKVPDLRGVFLRGVDGGRNFDADRNSRVASNPGGNSGDAVGSYQGDAVSGHTHTFSASGTTGAAGDHNHGVNGGAGQRGLVRQSATTDGSTTTDGADTGGRGTEIDVVGGGASAIPYSGNHTHSFSASGTTGSFGAAETRPENVGVNYFIKY